MRIHYRVTGEQIEIIRCFGTDPQIVLPERIEGLPVVRTAAYAFSDRKGAEEEDVRVLEATGLLVAKRAARHPMAWRNCAHGASCTSYLDKKVLLVLNTVREC